MTAVPNNIRFVAAPDGARLRIGHWRTDTGEARGCVLLVHGRTEFLEKYDEVVGELCGRGFDVWSMDWRGQGLSQRLLGNPHKGHIDRFETYIDDLAWFMQSVIAPARDARGPTVLLAHSMGGHIALRGLLEGRIAADRAVLSAPMIDLPLSRSGRAFTRSLARVAVRLGNSGRYAPRMHDYRPDRERFAGNALTADKARFARSHAALAANPALALGGVTYGWLDAALRSIDRLQTEAAAAAANSTTPILLCSALEDRIVSVTAQAGICHRLAGCTYLPIAGARHEILMEIDDVRAAFWAAFDAFVTEPKN